METNVKVVKASQALHGAASELAERAVDFCRVLRQHQAELEKPMVKAGRKAQRNAGTVQSEIETG
jgi:hypothetical protein